MKYLWLLLGLVFLAISACTAPVDIEAEKAAITTVLNNYVKSVETEDMDFYASIVAHDTAMVNFGGFGAPIVGWDALKTVMEGQNETLSETKIEVSDVHIHVSGDGKSAWATCLWTLKAVMGESLIALPVRCTWVLEKSDNLWIITHFHKSMAAG